MGKYHPRSVVVLLFLCLGSIGTLLCYSAFCPPMHVSLTARPSGNSEFEQIKQFTIGAVEQAEKELHLEKDGLSRVIARSDELQAGIIHTIGKLAEPPENACPPMDQHLELLEDVRFEPTLIHPSSLNLVPFLRDNERSINSELLIKRAKELNANFGQRQAKWLLEYQEEIPVEFRAFILLFPGTIWRDTTLADARLILCLTYDSSHCQWEKRYCSLGSHHWSGRLLSLSSSPQIN